MLGLRQQCELIWSRPIVVIAVI